MISCSHWGMFSGRRLIGHWHHVPIYECDDFEQVNRIRAPRGYEIEPGQEAEMSRPDGIVRIQRRPFLTRLRNHYRWYRKIGLSRRAALRAAWSLAAV